MTGSTTERMIESTSGSTRGQAAGRMSGRARALSAAVTLAGMVATPLNRRGGPARRVLSTVVVSGAFATTVVGAARRWGSARAGSAATATSVVTAALERVGTRSGIPFGAYSYTGALRPTVVGVPAIVPLAWFAMAVPARETAHAALGSRSSPVGRVVGGAAALTAWDLFLDPQMVAEGYWRWVRRGRYRGIPLVNFAGWFVTGLGVMALLELALPVGRGDGPGRPAPADGALVAEYAVMAAMETLGFAAFFRDRVVAIVGGSAMLPLALLAIVRRFGRT